MVWWVVWWVVWSVVSRCSKCSTTSGQRTCAQRSSTFGSFSLLTKGLITESLCRLCEAGREAGCKKGREAGREAGRGVGRGAGREAGRETRRGARREKGREAGREAGREVEVRRLTLMGVIIRSFVVWCGVDILRCLRLKLVLLKTPSNHTPCTRAPRRCWAQRNAAAAAARWWSTRPSFEYRRGGRSREGGVR